MPNSRKSSVGARQLRSSPKSTSNAREGGRPENEKHRITFAFNDDPVEEANLEWFLSFESRRRGYGHIMIHTAIEFYREAMRGSGTTLPQQPETTPRSPTTDFPDADDLITF